MSSDLLISVIAVIISILSLIISVLLQLRRFNVEYRPYLSYKYLGVKYCEDKI